MTHVCTATSVLATLVAAVVAQAQSTVGTDAPQAPVLAPASAQEFAPFSRYSGQRCGRLSEASSTNPATSVSDAWGYR